MLILVAHRHDVALEREAVAGLVAVLRQRGHQVHDTAELLGAAGSELVGLERVAEAADRILLVDPKPWWPRERPRDAWEQALFERVELSVANELDRFAVIDDPRRAGVEHGPLLGALRSRFVLPEQWTELLAWLASPPATTTALRTTGELRLPQAHVERPGMLGLIDRAIDQAPASAGAFVWIRGALGAGKTSLLAAWVARREAAGRSTIVHLARPGIVACSRPAAVLARIGAALGLGPIDDLRSITGDRSDPIVIAIDGLEQIVAAGGATPAELERLLAGLRGELPAGVIVIATSRPLAPGLLGDRTPDLDLDAPDRRARQLALVEAMIAATAKLPDPIAAAIRRFAGPNPGVARALLDRGSAKGLPWPLEAALERSFASVLALPRALQQQVLAGLALLRLAQAPIPASLLDAALGEQTARALEHHAAEWLRCEDGTLALAHPIAARFLAAELDDDDRLRAAWLAGVERLRARGALDAATLALVDGLERLQPDLLAWTHHVPELRRLAAEGELERRLADGFSSPIELTALTHGLVRRHASALARAPERLGGVLWSGLVARGVPPRLLDDEFTWGSERPAVRLQTELAQVDRSHRILTGHDDVVRGCAISEDGSRAITISSDSSLRVWDPRTGVELANIDVDGWGCVCALTPDGARAAVGVGSAIMLFDLDGGERISKHEVHKAMVTAVAISRDGAWVLSGDHESGVVLWDVRRGQTQRLEGHHRRVECCTISADGSLGITGGADKQVMIWDLGQAALRHTLRGHSYGVGGVALTPDASRLVSICIGEARVWDPARGLELACFEDHGRSCVGARIVADRAVMMASAEGRVTFWKLDDGATMLHYLAHPAGLRGVAASADGEWTITAGDDRLARVWRYSELIGSEPVGLVLAINVLVPGQRPGTAWVAGGGGATRLLELDGLRTVVELERYTSPVALTEFDGHVYLVGSNRRVEVFAVDNGAPIRWWDPSGDWLRAVAIDPQRRRLACAGDGMKVMVSTLDGRERREHLGHNAWIYALAFTSDGRLLAADGDGRLSRWDLDSGECEQVFDSEVNGVLHVLALDSAGARAAISGYSGVIELIDLERTTLIRQLEGHVGSVDALAFCHDDRILASAGRDRSVRLWSVERGEQLACIELDAPLNRVCLVGDRLLVGDVVGNLMVFEVDWGELEG